MPETLFWIIFAIVVIDFLFEKTLEYLNFRNLSDTLPDGLKSIYNEEKYKKSQQYKKATSKFSLIISTFSLLLILIMLFGNGFVIIDGWVKLITQNIYLQTLLFFGILGIASDLLSLPFQLYDTFVIEEKFGFNKTTTRTFFVDKLKSLLLSIILGGGILSFILWAWLSTGAWFWFIVSFSLAIFMIFMSMFYTRLIVPLFNKQTPLEEGKLKTEIYEFATKTGFKLDDVFIINGSKRSTKANAYFSGFGPKKRIILYDTLINDLTTDEIVAVLAHEIGHYKKKHVYKSLAMSLAQSALMIWILFLALGKPVLSQALGAVEPSFYIGLVAFGLLFTPISFLIGIFSNSLSRKFEYEADNFARDFSQSNNLISALIKLSVNNLSNLLPHPAYVFFHFSHPTLLQRKKALEEN